MINQASYASSQVDQQQLVNRRFDSEARHWVDIYEAGGRDFATVGSLVVRERHEQALSWIDRLQLPEGSRVLEVGGGAGLMSVALARRGFHVDAVDASTAMVELTRQTSAEAGCAESVSATAGDARSLAFADASFDLVVAIGVVSWLDRPEDAIREFGRVVKPGGHVLVTTFNRGQLIGLVDPLRNPIARPLMQRAKRLSARAGGRTPGAVLSYQSRAGVDRQMARAGLTKRLEKTLGFGPFTFFQQNFVPATMAIKLHRRLQKLADRGVPGLRSSGMFYMVLAEKPPAR